MKLYLCDHTHSSREKSKWRSALEKVFGPQFQSRKTQKWSEPENRHPAYRDANAILFCHSDGREARWKRKADSIACQVILVRSKGGQRSESNRTGNLHGCHWSPDDFVREPQSLEIQKWIEQVRSGEISQIDWPLLQPDQTFSAISIPAEPTTRELGLILVMGKGQEAKMLANSLRAHQIDFDGKPVKTARSLGPRDESDYWASVILLLPTDTAANVVRYHRTLWQVTGMNQVRIGILATSAAQADWVSRQDVYGRERGTDTFGKWADRYLILTRQDELLRKLSRLKPMWASTWKRNDSMLRTIGYIHRQLVLSLETGVFEDRTEVLHALAGVAWDCFYADHTEANRIRKWYERDENCNAWFEEGINLLKPVLEGR
jgi:hypothetical protein